MCAATPGDTGFRERHVVTCFLVHDQRILLLKRGELVRAYRGRWTAINGSVSGDPMTQAVHKIRDETGLAPSALQLVRRGSPLTVTEKAKRIRWQVHPFLFRASDPGPLQLTWQHTDHVWADPRTLDGLDTVPMLKETLDRVWDSHALGPREPPREETHDRGVQEGQEGSGEPGTHLRGLPAQPELRRDRVAPAPHKEEPRPNHAASTQGIPVRVIRATSIPRLAPAVKGAAPDGTPPRSRGKALLKDPILHPLLERLRHERTSGHALLIQRGLEALRAAADRSGAESCEEQLEDLRMVGRLISDIRPTSATLTQTIARLLYELEFEVARDPSLDHLVTSLDQAVARLKEQHQSDISQIAAEIARLIPPGATVMTTAYCVPLVEALQRCNQFGLRVLVLEHHPPGDGRMMARAAAALGKTTTLIADSAMGLHVQEADLVVVGAEALLADGSAVCPIGAYPLALVAGEAGIPFYIAAPLSALDLRPDADREVVLEEGSPTEVWEDADEGVEVRNVRHERVPSAQITGLITEEGFVQPASIQQEVRTREHLFDALFDQ